VFRHAEECTTQLDNVGLSDEFIYHRVGFFVAHYGRRGLTCLLYHFGAWVDMPEIYQAGWYRYGSDGPLEQLDFREPISCLHDVSILLAEFALWADLPHNEGPVRAYENYLTNSPVGL
jgi:hypothetical protein